MLGGFKEKKTFPMCSTPFWSDSIGWFEPNLGCSDSTISLYKNHLSKTRGSVTFQLA